jgi:hypothetical protein
MPNKKERLQMIWHHYETERDHQPVSAREAVEWAVAEGVLTLPEIDPYDVLAQQMTHALREETQADSKGRRYRVNHAMRVSTNGVQYTFWGVMGFAPHDHMEKSFAQRRELIIGECVQLRTDIDVYNKLSAEEQHQPIQLVMDFTEDVAERLAFIQDNAA